MKAQGSPAGTCSRYAARLLRPMCQNGARRQGFAVAAPFGAPLPSPLRSGSSTGRRAAPAGTLTRPPGPDHFAELDRHNFFEAQ
jgi:hypothetical protein